MGGSRNGTNTGDNRNGLRLRSTLFGFIAVLGLLAALSTGQLLWSVSSIRKAAHEQAAASEGALLAQELEILLVNYQRMSNLLALTNDEAHDEMRDDIRERMRQRLQRAEEIFDSRRMAALFRRAGRQTREYLDAREAAGETGRALAEVSEQSDAALHEAVMASDGLVRANVAKAAEVDRRTERLLEHMARRAVAGAVILFLSISSLAVIAYRYIYQPLLAVRREVDSIGRRANKRRFRPRGPRELREIAQALNEKNAALETQRQAQLTFLAGVAHDLRTPITAISLKLDHLLRWRDAAREVAYETLQAVSRQVGRLNPMVDDVLDSARIEAGEFTLRRARHDLRAIVQEAVELHSEHSAKHVSETHLPEYPVVIECDAVRVGQVLTNLVSNALKYSPEGRRVEVSLQRDGDAASLAVADEGIGIPQEDQARVFQPYQRTSQAAIAAPGVGLGLSVARKLVAAHGGSIALESEPGRGTTFHVELPMAGEAGPSMPSSGG